MELETRGALASAIARDNYAVHVLLTSNVYDRERLGSGVHLDGHDRIALDSQ